MTQPNAEGSAPEHRPMPPTFGEIVERSLALLERRRRVSHTALRLEFALDDATFAALREELVDVLDAATDDGRVLSARSGAPAAAPESVPPEPPAQEQPPPGAGADVDVEVADDDDRPRLTVLLCDLVETPALEALGADARLAVTERLHAICREVATRLRGHVQPWVSDGVAIFFGHPTARDDDAQRAVRGGWEILRTLDAAGDALEREIGLRVGARVSIATGAAGDGDDAANVFGDAPRLAGRVQARSTPGRVTVDAATERRARAQFSFLARGAGDLHDLIAPIDAGAQARRAPTPLVGRGAERALLQALAERAADGTRAAVLVRGEAGIGKTRLLEALAGGACESLGMTPLRCASSPYHRGSALHPLISGLRRHWQLDDAGASQRLAQRARTLPGGPRAVVLLADLLGVALPDGVAALAPMSPSRRRRETLATLADVLHAEALQAPLLVVIEDLHWADPTTIELVGTLLEGPREVALMLALTARSEFVPPASSALQRIELGRLDADESRRIAELVAGDAALPDGLADELAKRAGGSPLLAEELTRTVLATHDESVGAGTLYGCLMARMDRDTTARAVAQLAATVGREFDVALLEAVGGIERAALDWGLERLAEQDVVVAQGAGGYAFRHALLQDAVRSSLRQERLRDHNLRIARALLESFPHVAAAEPERVARHLEYAGELVASVAHWQRAGLQALGRHALREATGHFERGLELTARTPDGDERRGAELSLRVLAGLSIAAGLGWEAPAAVAHYARAEQLQRDLTCSPELSGAMLALTTHRFLSGRLEDAQALARRLVAVADATADRGLVLEAECEAGGALVHLGRHREALPRLARAIEISDAADHHRHAQRYGRNPAAIALAHRGLALACRDDREGARHAIAQAAAVLREYRHPYSQAWVQCAAAAAALVCGEREVVLRESAIALRIAGEEGFDDWLAQASVLHGWARATGGEHAEGAEQCRHGAAAWATTGAVIMRPFLQGLLGDALRRAGEAEFGLVAIEEALGWVAWGERWCEPELHRIRAELLLAVGDRPGALRSAQSAVALARRSGAAGWERHAATTLKRMSSTSPVG